MSRITSNFWGRLSIILAILLALSIIYLLSAVLLPFFIAILLAYFSNPLVLKLMRFGISRNLAVVIVFTLLFLGIAMLILMLVPIIQKQTFNLIALLPKINQWIHVKLNPFLIKYFDISAGSNPATFKNIFSDHLLKAGGVVSWSFKTVLTSSKALFETMLFLILIPVLTFYLLRDWDLVIDRTYKLIPRKNKPKVLSIAKECDIALGAFFRGQLLVVVFLSLYYTLALTLMGLHTGVLIGLIVGLISIIPYIGAIVGIIIGSVAALVEFGTFSAVISVWIIFTIGHLGENFYLSPRFIGSRIGLHPVIVIFAILAGGTLFGILGVLLALPVASVLVILLKHLYKYHYQDYLY